MTEVTVNIFAAYSPALWDKPFTLHTMQHTLLPCISGRLFYECPKAFLFASISSHHHLQSAHRQMFRAWALMVCLKVSEEKAVPMTFSSPKS